MSKHTPGPWRAPLIGGDHGTTGIIWADEPHGGVVATVSRTVQHPDPAEQTANARLIAAAPDMLAALERARVHMDCPAMEVAAPSQ